MLVYSPFATCMMVLGWLVSVLVYPIIYHGLLSIGVMLANPLGTDFINFPGSWYQHVMKQECKGFYTSCDSVNLHGGGTKWWAGITTPAPPASKTAPPPGYPPESATSGAASAGTGTGARVSRLLAARPRSNSR